MITINYVLSKLMNAKGNEGGLNAQKSDRCVSKVKSRSVKKANPYDVCN